MTSLKHKIKINNSYESESGGSSLSDHNECLVSDEENMQLPFLLKAPPSFENEITITTTEAEPDKIKRHTTQPTAVEKFGAGVEETESEQKQQRQLRYGIPLHSSEESSFEGFGESPFGGIQRQLCGGSVLNLGPSPGKVVFSKFYDTIVEENSSNAVDLKLSNEVEELPPQPPMRIVNSQGAEEGDYGFIALDDDNGDGVVDEIPAAELSFNGRIKSLTMTHFPAPRPPPSQSSTSVRTRLPTLLETSSTFLNCSQLSESFILKKYSNEKSPDLFDEDDSDDDVVNGDPNNCDDNLADETAMTTQPKYDQYDTSVNQSLNCHTESSFADDQTFDYTLLSQMAGTAPGTLESEDTQSLYRQNCRRERELLRRVRKSLAGLPPPPSLTIPQLDLFSAVLSRKEQIFNFFNDDEGRSQLADSAAASSNSTTAAAAPFSLFKPTHTLAETQAMAWKDVLGVRQHGLCFNLSKSSESTDYLSLAVVDRFIGAETASSYRNSPSSAKKRNSRLKLLTQSPGNRLSHLAKRRAVFSSANLATTSQKSSSSFGPQILLNKKKTKHRRKATPKRMTPGSKKKHRKTPSTSARKRLFRCDLIKPGPSRETSKRALFQSPAKQLPQPQIHIAAPKPLIKPEIANRVEKSKRALFSPDDKPSATATVSSSSRCQSQPFTSVYAASTSSSYQLDSLVLKRKRNPAEDEDSIGSKLFRGNSSGENLTPRALKIKSQSFCGGAGSSSSAGFDPAAGIGLSSCYANISASSRSIGFNSSSQMRSSSSLLLSGKMQRAHSDMSSSQTNSLTENQRKKLLWAVSQALQEKKIAGTHESFKQYASVLARVVRRIFQEYYQRSSTSNSETMLRLAKKYVYNVTAGKNADDIYFQAKAHIDETKRQSNNRLSGYIGREEYQQRQISQSQQLAQYVATSSCTAAAGSMQNLFAAADNSIDSFGGMSFSQTSSAFCGASATSSVLASQSSFLGNFSQELAAIAQQQLPIQPNAALQNSSSKNNLGGVALRENVDCEQRRTSAQKFTNFTGKDQRNVSPYASATTRLGSALKTKLFAELTGSGAKAKRQISFDS